MMAKIKLKANDKNGRNICSTYEKELIPLIQRECPYFGEKTNNATGKKMGESYKQAICLLENDQ